MIFHLRNDINIDIQSKWILLSRAWAFKVADYKTANNKQCYDLLIWTFYRSFLVWTGCIYLKLALAKRVSHSTLGAVGKRMNMDLTLKERFQTRTWSLKYQVKYSWFLVQPQNDVKQIEIVDEGYGQEGQSVHALPSQLKSTPCPSVTA